jgi:hypothetical protein
MATIPDIDSSIRTKEGGHCSITLIGGNTVETPWIVPQQPLGASRFQLHEDVVKQMARTLGLVDSTYFEELIDQRDAKLEELGDLLVRKQEEIDMLKPAAQRWYASETAKDNIGKRNKNEQKLDAALDTIAKLRAQLAETTGVAA